ncbi:acyl-CoA dehydrogenase family protein [Cryptosporangium sp. NPDC048952]|uniref:acyl-CoA dehydrogenase family protein n=1 Tax=Cryptosporangium sp. NPDC048952 TaxID=3363961 RepID=UPI0037201198
MSIEATTGVGDSVRAALARVASVADEFEAAADETERLCRLSDRSVAALKQAQLMRLLAPREHGGHEAHPRAFGEAVMEVARRCGASGWVAGVVGVHPWELAMLDPRVGEEVWGENPDTWVASPYTPSGVAERVDGGYVVNGNWQFSSGTDHADWVVLGALTGDGNGRPAVMPEYRHVLLPRGDYEIVDDSWNVIGLNGTGSKTVAVKEAFVPDYRTVAHLDVATGVAADRVGRQGTLYRLPFPVLFPLGITAAVIGIAEGALGLHLAYQRNRINAAGVRIKDDPYSMYAISEAAADIAASRAQLLDGVSQAYDRIDRGYPLTPVQTAELRRNQVRSAWRAVAAVDEIFARSGGNAGRRDNPLQRFWRDAHMGLQHFIHGPGPVYHATALLMMDVELPDALRGVI